MFFAFSYNLFFFEFINTFSNPSPNKDIKALDWEKVPFVLNLLKIIKSVLYNEGFSIKSLKVSFKFVFISSLLLENNFRINSLILKLFNSSSYL